MAWGFPVDEYQTLLYKVQGLAVISLEELCVVIASEEDKIRHKETKKTLADAIDILPEKERVVFSLHYYDEITLKDIADIIGSTESRICQLHTQAILRLKGKLRSVVKKQV